MSPDDGLQGLINALGYAAGEGAQAIAAAVTHTGAIRGEIGVRVPGKTALAVSGLGTHVAHLAGTGAHGVSQEAAPIRGAVVRLEPIADGMADEAADDGVRLILR